MHAHHPKTAVQDVHGLLRKRTNLETLIVHHKRKEKKHLKNCLSEEMLSFSAC